MTLAEILAKQKQNKAHNVKAGAMTLNSSKTDQGQWVTFAQFQEWALAMAPHFPKAHVFRVAKHLFPWRAQINGVEIYAPERARVEQIYRVLSKRIARLNKWRRQYEHLCNRSKGGSVRNLTAPRLPSGKINHRAQKRKKEREQALEQSKVRRDQKEQDMLRAYLDHEHARKQRRTVCRLMGCNHQYFDDMMGKGKKDLVLQASGVLLGHNKISKQEHRAAQLFNTCHMAWIKMAEIRSATTAGGVEPGVTVQVHRSTLRNSIAYSRMTTGKDALITPRQRRTLVLLCVENQMPKAAMARKFDRRDLDTWNVTYSALERLAAPMTGKEMLTIEAVLESVTDSMIDRALDQLDPNF